MLRSGTLLVLFISIIAVFVGFTAAWGWWIAQPGPLPTAQTVTIEKGSGVNRIAQTLHKNNIIDQPWMFQLAVRGMGLSSSLQAGTYRFHPGIPLKSVVRKMAVGDVQRFQITIPEGLTVEEVRQKLDKTEKLAGPTPMADEGFLLPETYGYLQGMKRADIIKNMQTAAEKVLGEAWRDRSPDVPLNSPLELLTLASIIEKETSKIDEMETVSGVYINRLRKGMKLQADPTIIYGLIQAGTYNGNLRKKHLQSKENPYNTYMHKGLPPGPICNPGAAAIRAAANPQRHNYLFFVATGTDGRHLFAQDYDQHKKNVQAYLENYRKQQKQ